MTGGTAPPLPAARSTPGEPATSAALSIAWASARRTRSSAISSRPALKPRNVVESVGERSATVSGAGDRGVAHELEVVAPGEPIAERRLLAALAERDSHLADVARRRAPVGIRGQQRAHLVHLGEHERPVADERLGPPPGRPDLVRAVARPRIGPVRGEHVREVVARLAQVHLERPVVERLGRLDVVQQERRDVPLLAQLAPGVDEVLGRERVPVAPAGVLAQHEQVGQAVGRDVHVLGQLGHDVEVVVDAQEAAEELLDHDRGVARVRVAGRVGIGPARARSRAAPGSARAPCAPRRSSRTPRRRPARRARSRTPGGARARS